MKINSKFKILFILIFFFGIFGWAENSKAATYYVSTNGSDSNTGSLASPWATMQKASGNVSPGDTVYLRGGTYYNQNSSWNTDGTEENPITILGYGEEKAIFDGQGTVPSGAGSYMFMLRGDWYVLKNIEIANSGQSGVWGGGAHVKVQNMDIHHSYSAAITLTGDFTTAENNHAWSNGMMNENYKSGPTGGWPATVTCARYPKYCTLRGNVVHDNWGEGISTFETMYTTIENNISYNNQQNFYLSDTKYSLFQRNIGYCTPGNVIDPYETQNGLLVGDEKGVPVDLTDPGGARIPSSDNKILNNFFMGCDRNLAAGTNQSTNNIYAYNTFVNSGGDASERANVLLYGGSCANCRFSNNLILQENSIAISLGGGTGWQFSNNLWSKNPGSTFLGSNSLVANPLLAKTGLTGPGELAASYFKILDGSPAIDKAVVLSEVADDYFKTARGISPDIGAYEYVSGGDSNPPAAPSGLSVQ